jgi:predicted short-subunit dehydrogenase-like oxidoreductase (DUF2520 family)
VVAGVAFFFTDFSFGMVVLLLADAFTNGTIRYMVAKRTEAGASGRLRKGISIVGLGNWGSSLAAGVVQAKIPLNEVVVRRKPNRRLPDQGTPVVLAEQALYDAQILWICVPDAEIGRVAAQIVERRPNLEGQLVIHSSGALTVAALDAVKKGGARVAGAAPVLSFPTREPVSLMGVLFAVEGEPGVARKVSTLVKKLGGKPFRVSSEQKVLYHAAATMASPLLVSGLHAAIATARAAGLGATEAEAVVRVLATATLRNYFEKGSGRSFSGAFARGDSRTVELHLEALLAHPTLHGIYSALARGAVTSLTVKNRVELEEVLEMERKDGGA